MEEKERGWPLCDVLCAKRSVAGHNDPAARGEPEASMKESK